MTREEARLTLQENYQLLEFEHPGRIADAINVALEALSQPSLPSNLEEAAEEAAKTWRKNPDGSESREIFFLPFVRGFKAGVKWHDSQIPKLPDNLEEAAKKEIDKLLDAIEIDSDMIYLPTAKALMVKLAGFGAEWMAGQGWKEVDNQNYPTPDKKKIYIVYTKEHYHLARVINHPKDDNLYQWKCTEFPNYRYDMCEGDKYFEIRRK